ncbi:MAG: hypothetical protein Q4D53_06680 [Leptotrichiaceae bacterium]|nr:hypothetical protein [Leptotrichiaceae bacterium]
MKKNNYGLLVSVISGIVLAVGILSISRQFSNNMKTADKKEYKTENTVVSNKTLKISTVNKDNQNSEIILSAEKFINDYINENINLEDWLAASPVTENFRKVYKERTIALELVEKFLNNEKLSKSERELLNKYEGIEYDALLSGIIFDISPGHSKFKVKSWDEKTGIMILKDTIKPEFPVHSEGEPVNMEVKLKLVKLNGKWLIDSAWN